MITPSRGKARIGVLVPFTNTNLEADMALLRPDGVSVHFARLGGYDIDEIPDASQMAGLGAADIDETLRMLSGVKPDVILYGCTSATLTHGPSFDRELASKIKVLSGAATVTAAGALVHALKALKVTKVGFASPYVSDINQQAISFLADCGFESVSRAEVTETLDNYGQGEMGPDKIFELGLSADSTDAEAVVLSCTDMRSVEVIDRLEQALGKPVITSNQAMIFETLQFLKIDTYQTGYGQLFTSLEGQ
jgi:maleate cis-trans isomerase